MFRLAAQRPQVVHVQAGRAHRHADPAGRRRRGVALADDQRGERVGRVWLGGVNGEHTPNLYPGLVFDWLADTWDGIELWVAQLWFPVQFALVMVVLLPILRAVAWLIERVVDRLSAWLAPRYRAEPTLWGAEEIEPVEVKERPADVGAGRPSQAHRRDIAPTHHHRPCRPGRARARRLAGQGPVQRGRQHAAHDDLHLGQGRRHG